MAWRKSSDADEAASCSFSKVRRKQCTTVEDPETQKPIRKCEKTEQVLKHCLGRPTEIVESKTEYTEEEVSKDELVAGHGFEEHHSHFRDYNRPENGQDDNPFLRIPDFIEGQFNAGMESFLQAAEEMANELFGQFGFHSDDPPRSRSRPRSRPDDDFFQPRSKPEEPQESSAFSDYSGFQEV